MSLVGYLLVLAVWVGAIEYVLQVWRKGEYRRIGVMRRQAESLLREAQLARLRAGRSMAAVSRGPEAYQRRAS